MSDDNISSDSEPLSESEEVGKRKHIEDHNNKNTQKRRKKDLLKPPTTEELNQLRETENLYSSNLIRLQIEEVLAEISVKQKLVQQIENWWDNFKNTINNLKAEEEILLSEIKPQNDKRSKRSKFINELFENRTNLTCDRDITIKFPSPVGVECSMLGAYHLKCLIKSNMKLSVNIQIPADCFSAKDYLNNRYFIKRHYYLLYILHRIKKAISPSKVKLVKNNFKSLPVIRISPDFSEKIEIDVHVTPSEGSFNLNRFLPDKNNVKYDVDDNFKDVDAKSFGEVATPLYNSVIARDCTLCANYKYMANLLNVENIQNGIKLLMLWLTQRQLNKGTGNFTDELLFYGVTYLVKTKKINLHMSSYQVVRIFWSFIRDSKWNDEPISICDDVKSDTMDTFRKNYDIAFLDVTGCFNVASFLHIGVYLRLKQEANLALNILDSNGFSSFSSLFLVKVPFTLQYDAVVMLKDENKFKTIYENASTEKKWKYYGFYNDLIMNEISSILREAFAKRASSIVPYIREEENEDSNSIITNLTVGLNLNPEFAFNVIERGPSEDDPKAVQYFQTFWKGLTSFRRFQDTSVAEVVYFKSRTLQDKRNIFVKILNFLFTNKYPLNMKIVANHFENVLKLNKAIIHFPTGTNEEACIKINHIYNDLNKIIRSLELPLIITHVQGSSDAFSYTEVFPPIPTTYKADKLLKCNGNKLGFKTDMETLPNYVSPIECVFHIGKSTVLPDDIAVLRCMKCQFYIQLSESLETEHNIKTSVTLHHLDVLYEGLVFRFRLFVPKELVLLKKVVDSEGVTSYKDNEESVQLERDLEISPKITSALSGVHQRYPSFGPCCALTKRWLRSQLMDGSHISDTVINLWVASMYLNSAPYEVAHLPQVAFLRFLKYIVDFDWKLSPVIVNFNDDISSTSLSEMEAQFQQDRNRYPNLYIITPFDEGKSVFTKTCPSKKSLKRIRLLANETYNFLDDVLLKWDNFPLNDIFKPSLEGYDVVINLKDSVNLLRRQNLMISDLEREYIERYDESLSGVMPIVNFNPIEKYLAELREIYGEYAVFFHDPYGGTVIGVLWNREILEPIEFKVLHVNGRKLVNDKLAINYDAILEDIYNRGSGIIEGIEKNVIL